MNSPYLKVYPDSGNLTNAAVAYHTRVSDDLETGRGSISAVHLKETKPGVFREVPYGTGHVDFVDVIKTAWSQCVRLYNAEFWYVGRKTGRIPCGKTTPFCGINFSRLCGNGLLGAKPRLRRPGALRRKFLKRAPGGVKPAASAGY